MTIILKKEEAERVKAALEGAMRVIDEYTGRGTVVHLQWNRCEEAISILTAAMEKPVGGDVKIKNTEGK